MGVTLTMSTNFQNHKHNLEYKKNTLPITDIPLEPDLFRFQP